MNQIYIVAAAVGAAGVNSSSRLMEYRSDSLTTLTMSG